MSKQFEAIVVFEKKGRALLFPSLQAEHSSEMLLKEVLFSLMLPLFNIKDSNFE